MKMTDYVVVIPSYKRAEVCNTKTLRMLKENSIKKENIYVYVANKEEYEEYSKVLDKSLYSKIVVGVKGLVPQRQFIMNKFPSGKHLVFFDDDVQSVDLSLSPVFKGKSLNFFFKYAFKECEKNKSYIWGVYPVFNPFFRKERPEMTTNLNYIVGAFYGIINRPNNKNIVLTLTKENGQKEDVERTIKYFIEDGIVLRFDRIGFVTKYYGKSGGLGTFEDRLKPMLEASKLLKNKYPEYGEISTKKNGMTEFRLKKIPAFSKGDGVNSKTISKKTIKNKGSNGRKTRKNKKGN